MNALTQFNDFLRSIDIDIYREKYSHIKLVELDFPENIRAISRLYEEYWERRKNYPDFDLFYRGYEYRIKDELEQFRMQKEFSKETFYRGLPARIYRTWASLLTQIECGYVAEELYGQGRVQMNSDLDYSGIDIRVKRNDKSPLNIQIKKDTLSREVRVPRPITKRNVQIVLIEYAVPGCGPTTPTGKESIPFQRWSRKWRNKLERLDNGFIIFLPDILDSIENILPPSEH